MAKRDIVIDTADGKCPAGLFTPEGGGRHPGVLYYMDAFGPRPATDEMAERLVAAGYIVLVPDLFYRFGDYGPFDAKTAFNDPDTGQKIRSMLTETTQDMTVADTGPFLDALGNAGAQGKVGTTGYCMGGGRALRAAASFPDRVGAAASFHGGNLASDAPDSPHKFAGDMKGARVYVGVAGVDRSFPPEQSARLALALREAEVDHIMEDYVGMAHGWTVPDHDIYDEKGAERHWKRLLDLYRETLH